MADGQIEVIIRPSLNCGMLMVEKNTKLPCAFIIDSEQSLAEQHKTFWHEFAHLFGIDDCEDAERLAEYLYACCPDILDKIVCKRSCS